MSLKISITHIAQELNTTPSTVLRALNTNYSISKKTTQIVRETAQGLNYKSNKIASSLILLVCFSVLAIQSFSQTKTSLDENWKFFFGHAANPDKDFNYGIATVFAKSGAPNNTAIDTNFNDTKWRVLDIPHDWAVELPFAESQNPDVGTHGFKPVGGLYPATSIGWYRKKFSVNEKDSGHRFQLQFDGIFRNANIWLNGFFVGNNMSGYMGASYDVTDYIDYKKANVLVVRVDATQYEGWFYEGAGIYRHVWLNKYNNVHVSNGGLFVYTEQKGNTATVTVETTVENNGLQATNASLYSYITTRDGKVIAQTNEQAFTIALNGNKTIKLKLPIQNPRLWQLEDPYLYRVISVVKANNKIVDTKKERFGIRTTRFDVNEGFFLNEKRLMIQGTCNHQDHAGVGVALPDYLNYYRVQLLKNMGVNAYRTSHNPPAPELLEACDSLGMLVMDENRYLNSSPEYLAQFDKLILRDRNHPSIFVWSLGNEEFAIEQSDYGKRVAQTLINRLKILDPSRTCTYANDVGNVFQGVNEVIPIRGFNYREFAIADYHKAHPQQPILGTEMGSTVTTRGQYEKDTIRCYLPDHDITAPWWASTAEAWRKLLEPQNKYCHGAFVWTGFDYRGEPTPFTWPNINSHFGILDMCGFPKNNYYYYQSWWTDKDVLNISPHWNWTVKLGVPPPIINVWVNSNADSVELFLNNKSLGTKTMPRNGHLQWAVTYAPGKLEAIGYKGKKIIRAKIETTTAPAEIVLTPSKTTLLADGRDAVVMNINIIDKEGREVSDANNMIRFYISGPAKIIGVGNGDPSCHEPDKCTEGAWQRSTFNGKCQIIIQSTKEGGSIKLEASSPGLHSGSTDVIAVPLSSINAIKINSKYRLTEKEAKPREVSKATKYLEKTF